jgi:hypothetical protein
MTSVRPVAVTRAGTLRPVEASTSLALLNRALRVSVKRSVMVDGGDSTREPGAGVAPRKAACASALGAATATTASAAASDPRARMAATRRDMGERAAISRRSDRCETAPGPCPKGTLRAVSVRALGLPVFAAVAVLVAGCGGGPSEEKQVRDTLGRYQRATAARDYKQLCDRVLARTLVARLARVNLPCEQALRMASSVRQPTLQVLKVKVTGTRALALVRSSAVGEPSSTDTFELVKDGEDWRISALAQPGPPAPQRPLVGH